MLKIDPKEVSTAKLHAYMLSSVGPRPIALASTLSEKGIPNLAPFSFFNAFGSKPPTLIFSPSRRLTDATTKHTMENAKATGEVVVNVVTYEMIQQVSLASSEYPEEVNEFEKSGLTQLPSEKVKPFRVAESPVQFECKVNQLIEMGEEGGAANLIVCEILLMHISEAILDADQRIDQNLIDLVGRVGGPWYSRTNATSIFQLNKPKGPLGMGVDQIPEAIRNSKILTGNDLGKLGSFDKLPDPEDVEAKKGEAEVSAILQEFEKDPEGLLTALHRAAQQLLEEGQVLEAWKLLLISN